MTKQSSVIPYVRVVYWNIFIFLTGSTAVYTIKSVTVEYITETITEAERFSSLADERPVGEDILTELQDNDVFYDIGSNVGTYACLAGVASIENRVVAFEPHPKNIKRLKQNLDLNCVCASVYPVALSDESGTLDLAVDEDEAGAGEHALASSDDQETIPVDVVQGDKFRIREGIEPPNVIKIDVEGAELQVLDGLQDTLAMDTCRLVYVEVHPEKIGRYDGDEQMVRDCLVECGFDVAVLFERGNEFFLKAYR